MKESEYILVRNLSNITTALNLLRDTLPGFDGVVTEKELKATRSQLAEWQDKIHQKIDKENLVKTI